MLLNILQCIGKAPERMIWSKVSVLRLTNPDTDESQVLYILEELSGYEEITQIHSLLTETAHALLGGLPQLFLYCIRRYFLLECGFFFYCCMAKNLLLNFESCVNVHAYCVCEREYYAGVWGRDSQTRSLFLRLMEKYSKKLNYICFS